MRRDASASAVFGKSNAMRAGLSMVNGSGSGAGPLMCSLSCTCWPDSVCTSMDSSLTGSAAWRLDARVADIARAVPMVPIAPFVSEI